VLADRIEELEAKLRELETPEPTPAPAAPAATTATPTNAEHPPHEAES